MRSCGPKKHFPELEEKNLSKINLKTSFTVFPHNIRMSIMIAMTPATLNFKPLVNTCVKFVRLRKGKFCFERYECSR